MEVYLYYPDDTSERYSPAAERAVRTFTWLLFEPDRLGEVTLARFKEYLKGKGRKAQKTLGSLAELQTYRVGLGHPILRRVNIYAVPPSRAAYRLDGSGKRFDFDGIIELIFDIPLDDLPKEQRMLLPRGTLVPIKLRLREAYQLEELTDEDEPVPGAESGQLFVASRSYWPILEDREGEPGSQHPHVGRQVNHYIVHGTAMATSPQFVPTWQMYNRAVVTTVCHEL
jgi:hypothetical protein